MHEPVELISGERLIQMLGEEIHFFKQLKGGRFSAGLIIARSYVWILKQK
jgi:hypothetical protein